MSLFTSLSTSLTGLQASSVQLQVISNNIANAGREGFTQKRATVESINLGETTGGVRVSGNTRLTSDALFRSLRDSLTDDGLRSTQNEYAKRLTELFGINIGQVELTNAYDRFANAWRLLQSSPESAVRQREVIQTGMDFAGEVRRLSAGIEELERNARAETTATVTALNAALANVATLNQQISDARINNQPSGDFEDQRDQILKEIAGYVDITILPRDRGQAAIYTKNGYNLLDVEARTFSFDGTNLTAAGSSSSLNSIMTGGKIQALINFRADNSPATASTDAGTEVVRKLRSVLNGIYSAFTTSSAGPPATFAYAYNTPTAATGELATGFFTGTDRTNFDVATALKNGTSTVKVAAADDVTTALNDNTRTFSADGLSISNASYGSLVREIASQTQENARIIKNYADVTKAQKDFFKERYENQTGVNIDNELVALTTLQNSYSASARVISVVNELFDIIEGLLR
jgi:flagellar hook-associated protein 1